MEDNPDALEMMVQSLSAAGLQVAAAPDAAAAVRVAGSFTPVVAVLDIGLPGTDGYDLARSLLPILSLSIAQGGFKKGAQRPRPRMASVIYRLSGTKPSPPRDAGLLESTRPVSGKQFS